MFNDSKKPSIKLNYIYRLIYEVLTMFLPFITAPYIARVLGADGVGIFSYTQSFMMYFTIFASLGSISYATREIAQCRDDKKKYSKTFWEMEIIIVCSTAVCLLVWMGIIYFSTSYKVYFIAMIPHLVSVAFDISWFYTGHEKIAYTIIWNSICKIIGVVCIFVFVNDNTDIAIYILINSLVLMIGNMSMWMFLPKMIERVSIRSFVFKKHLKETFIYFVPTIATSIYTVLDKTLIGLITHDNFENGYYEQATKIINMAKTGVFVSVNSVMGARISYLFSIEKNNEIKEKIGKALSFILLLAYGAMFGIISVASTFVPVFYGDGYYSVIRLLYCMSPLIVIIGISSCLGVQYYTPAGLRAQSTKYIISGSVINLIMNLIFIPLLGAMGAVMGSILAEIVITILYVKNCNSYLKWGKILEESYKRIIAGIIMMVFVLFINRILFQTKLLVLVLQITLGVIIYFIVLILLKDKLMLESLNKYMLKVGNKK